MKKVALFAFIIILIVCAGCENGGGEVVRTGNASTTTASATEEGTIRELLGKAYDRTLVGKYSHKDTVHGKLKVWGSGDKEGAEYHYPQFVGLPDKPKQDELNDLISRDALRYIRERRIGDEPGDIKFAIYEYEIKLKTPELISVFYLGEMAIVRGKHGSVAQCVTIDINTLQVLKLSDFVNIDNALIDKILASKKFFSSDESLTQEEIMDEVRFYCTGFDKAITMKVLNEQSNGFYVTPNAIGVLVSTPHANHWVEIEYD